MKVNSAPTHIPTEESNSAILESSDEEGYQPIIQKPPFEHFSLPGMRLSFNKKITDSKEQLPDFKQEEKIIKI